MKMDELKEVLDRMPAAVRVSLGHGALLRMSKVKKIRKQLEAEGFDVQELDQEIDLLKGTKESVGLFQVLDVQEEKSAKKEQPDPLQRGIEDERDYRTHGMNTSQVRELVAAEISDTPPVAAIRALNALEDGENDREGGPRESVLKVIRDARKPLVAKVDRDNGGETAH